MKTPKKYSSKIKINIAASQKVILKPQMFKITFIQLQFSIISPAFTPGGIHVQVSSHLTRLTCQGKLKMSSSLTHSFKSETKTS